MTGNGCSSIPELRSSPASGNWRFRRRDRPLAIDLTSATVMQSFFIPALGSQIYAMAGMVTHSPFEGGRARAFSLARTRSTTASASRSQRFSATAMTPADFTAWSAHVKATRGFP